VDLFDLRERICHFVPLLVPFFVEASVQFKADRMDLSKLPRLSETDKHAASPGSPAAAEHGDADAPARREPIPVERVSAGVGAEVWISLIIGIILMLLGQSFARWSIATLSGQPFHTNVHWTDGPKAGREVDYWELSGFTAWTDMAIFLFGLAMVLEAAMLAVVYSRMGGKVLLTTIALGVTVVATALNLFVCFKLFGVGILPLMSALAVAFGGYMCVYEWRLLGALRSTRA
jgi:hypothetical protein